ncbi:origin recognition complex subunit 1-like [Panonychus citri]|uniref:origin recognition complex subunit 1-like n=1 Tax=Panonychus citri TaxID=50023 RepID=UPI002307C0B0|nr:origin recognition complex subunit 1-like [Panonychus citri]
MENLRIAKQNLRTSAPLKEYKLPCREKEFDHIYDFIITQFTAQTGGCLYLAGVPGTGKTATVRGVRRSIEENATKLKIKKKSLLFIEVNGLKLTDPYQVYSQVYYGITGERKAAKKAGEKLHELFCEGGNDRFIVLIVDELDSLQTTKQDILYHLFDWPSRVDSKLVVIAIANTHDLPERMEKRVGSRAGFGRLPFHPYKHEQLQSIVAARLKGISETFKSDGIQLIARKVASISGDARKVLDICRRSIEIAEEDFAGRTKSKGVKFQVSLEHVKKAVAETTSSPKMIYIRDASEFEKNLLLAICKHFQISGTEEGTCSDIFAYWSEICAADGSHGVNFSEFLEIAHCLHESRLINLEPDKVDNQRRIRLIVSTDDIDFALRLNE